MTAAVVILAAALLLAVLYIAYILLQIRDVTRQLEQRICENTRQQLRVSLLSGRFNRLAAAINRSLEAEEAFRIEYVHEEKRFKELIANLSHDLRTPITAVKGYLQLVDRGALSSDQREKLQVAQKHTDALGDLIEHFFEYSCLESAAPSINPERINLNNLVAECLAAAVPELEQKGLKVNLNEPTHVFIWADREMTARIIRNLIRNCTQHAAGDINVTVESSQNAVLSFKNLVNEADSLDAARLFDRFYTADRARRNGTGLGLAIVRLLAEQMGGAAGASLQNGALEIRVTLPLFR